MATARAYLPEGRIGHDLARLRSEVARIMAGFVAAGASELEPPALLSAGTLLDLYGEDIRTRAYVTHDPVLGEQILRPDFTVPVVEMHVAAGQEPARYAYAGPVWRMQEPGSQRPNEYLQVGYEIFDRGDRAARDAEVFALFSDAVAGSGLRAVTGDLGVIHSAVSSLEISQRRKEALLRHIWRPARFSAVLRRYGMSQSLSARRTRLFDALRDGSAEALISGSAWAGLRDKGNVLERAVWLLEDAEEPPLPSLQADALMSVLGLDVMLEDAPAALRSFADRLPDLTVAADRIAARAAALRRNGIATEALPFEAGYGRTTMEYYDGFVFELSDPKRPDLPPIATGGRYDALTRALAGGAGIPAVGGVIRPEVLLARGVRCP